MSAATGTSAPAHLWVPPARGTYGAEVADLAEMYGRPLDAAQRVAVDAIASYGPGGRWLTLETAVVMPRQNGKTAGVLLPVVLADLFLWGGDRIVWTAHVFRTARDAFNDVKAAIDGTKELRSRVKKITEANGEEAVELNTGARLEFLARSKGGGRGLGGKRMVFDEALFLSAQSMGALIPTLSARENPQIMYGSSAGIAESDHLRSIRDRGRAGGDPSLAYAEWCAPGSLADPGCEQAGCGHEVGAAGCALDDEAGWAAANPALGTRIGVEYVRAERRALPPMEWARERLGWWDEPAESSPIDAAAWSSCADPTSSITGRPRLAVDVSPGLASGAVAAAGTRADGMLHLELVAHRRGVDWLPQYVADVQRRQGTGPVALAASGPVRALLPELEAAGVEVEKISEGDVAAACAQLASDVAARAVRHLGDPLLAAAVAGAARRDAGDGGWAWRRATSAADISPLVAVTLARFGVERDTDSWRIVF